VILGVGAVLFSCKSAQEKHREEIDAKMEQLSAAFEAEKLSDSLALSAAVLHLDYIQSYPGDTAHNPHYYYKATQLLTDAGRYDRALSVADSFLAAYPQHDLRPYVMHFKGYFIYEQGLKDLPKAKRTYLKFLEEYPEHEELTNAVLFSLEHLGKPDDKVLEDILRNNEHNPQ
jgi:outer membrane protein assembly factor BamD (BamD/ComL family)